MKRLLVTGARSVRFDECPVPDCPADGLLIRARLTAVSTGTELRVYRAIPVDEAGEFLHETVPFVLPTENGYSMVGDVIEVGTDVAEFAVGDRVFAGMPHKEFAAVPARLAVKLPDEVSDEQAVFLNIVEVAHIALRRGRPAIGADVAVVGQGVIGLSALAWCRACGLRTAVIDREAKRLELARAMGADLAVAADDGTAERVVEFFDGEGADLVLEAASNWAAVRTGMEVARRGGRVVIVSRHTQVPDFNPVGHPFLGKKLELLTSYGHEPDGSRWDRRQSNALALRLMAEGRLDVTPMITHRFASDDLPEAYARLDSGEPDMVGVVIRWR